MIKTTAIFRCVLTLSNGTHKIVRMTIDKVAQLCAAVRQLRDFSMLVERYERLFSEIGIHPEDFACCKFINERTGEVLIEI